MKLVSIIVPSFNAGGFLEPALRSILNQTYRDIEVLVVDDGSTDGSVSRARDRIADSRVRWFHQPNAGKPTAMNVALSHATGEYYALQDADDISYPDRIGRLVHTLELQGDLAAVFSGHDVIVRGRPMAPTCRLKTPERCRQDIARMAMPAHDPTAMYRLSLVKNLAYEAALRAVEGFDYVLRVGEMHPMLVLGECLYSYRIHASSVTRADPVHTQALVNEVRRRARERRRVSAEWQLDVEGCERPRRRRHDPENGLASHFILSVQDQRNRGHRWAAIQTGLQCARIHPLTPQYLKAALYAVSPDWLRSRVPSYA